MKKINIIILIIAVVLLILAVFAFSGKKESNKQEEVNMNQNKETENSELTTKDVKEGDGAEAETGKTVVVHYVGTFKDGTKFDSSRDRGAPFSFRLGAGMVIAGWDQGVVGMKEGGVRKLEIPPNLAYGPSGVPGAIPPNSTLLFEVELLEVR